eukprot:scaffold71387_cov58-Attheya_sp.AAC.1
MNAPDTNCLTFFELNEVTNYKAAAQKGRKRNSGRLVMRHEVPVGNVGHVLRRHRAIFGIGNVVFEFGGAERLSWHEQT